MNGRRIPRLFLISLVLALLAWAGVCNALDHKNVLILNSYHVGYEWSDDMMEGVLSVLENHPEIGIWVEYMDTKRRFGPDYLFALEKVLETKFPSVDLDAVLAMDDNAFNFAVQFRDHLFPGLPIVFSGVVGADPDRLAGIGNTTGIVETPGIAETIVAARKLFPDRNHLVGVTDCTLTGQLNGYLFQEVLESFPPGADGELLECMGVGELKSRLADMPMDSVVLVLSLYRDAQGQVFAEDQAMDVIQGATDAPVFALWNPWLEWGALGGWLMDGYEQGRVAARLLVQILSGEDPDDIPPVRKSPGNYVFSYEEMDRLGLSETDLPEGAKVVGGPERDVAVPRQTAILVLAAVALLCLVVFLLLFNILRRRRAEAELRAGVSFLETLLDAIPSPVYFKDRWGRYTGCNKAFEEYVGISKENIKGRQVWDVAPTQLAEEYKRRDEELFAKGGIQTYAFQVKRADGERRQVVFYKAPYSGPRGEVAGLVGIIVDVTEETRMKEALTENEAKYRAYVDSAPQGIFVVDGQGRLVDANPSARAMTGYAQDVLLSMSISDLRFSDDVVEQAKQFKILKQQGRLHETVVLRRKDGARLYADLRAVRLENERFMAHFTDIGQRIAMERDLIRAKEEAEEANAAKSRFLANMSHEMRTPLNGTLGMLELLELMEPDQEQAEYIGLAKDAANSLLGIVNDLLDLSAVEAGRLKIKHEPFSLRLLVDGLVNVVYPQARKKNLELDVSLSSKVADGYVGDGGRLRQVLTNLLVNAVKFTEEGRVSLRIEQAGGDSRADPERGREVLRFIVDDSGIGIGEDMLEQVFNPFTQVEGVYTRKYGGAGLGLAISRQLVESMQGQIWAESDAGGGSTFFFDLPLARQEMEEGPQDREPRPSKAKGRGRILLAEDNMINRVAVKKYLEKQGFEVDEAENGRQALDGLASKDYDLLLLDIQMPEMNGLQVGMAVRNGEEGVRNASIPIIALTAYAYPQDERSFRAAGMNGYVPKPVDFAQLREVIGRHLGTSE